MLPPFLVDTDVLIDFLRGKEKAFEWISANIPRIILSSIVVAELYAGAKGEKEFVQIKLFISLSRVIPVTTEIAANAGLYKRNYGKSHGTGLADSIIAATCDAEKAQLKTFNTKHYPMIEGLSPVYKK